MTELSVRLEWFRRARSSRYAVGIGAGIVIAGCLLGGLLFFVFFGNTEGHATGATPLALRALQVACALVVLGMVIGGLATAAEGTRQLRTKDQAVLQIDAAHLTWNGRNPIRLGWAEFGEANLHVVWMGHGIRSTFLRLLPGTGLSHYRDLYLDDLDVDIDQLVNLIRQIKAHGPAALVNQPAKGRVTKA